MKKRIAITLAGLLAVAGLSSCGGSDDSTLVIWHDKTDAVVEVLQKAIEEKLPEEKVEFVRRDSMTDQLKLVGNDPSSCPDMYIFAHDKIGLFATLGILEDLDSLIDPSSYEESVPLTLEAMEYEGTNYGLPLYYETTLFLYNRDLVGDKDPSLPALPSTTEELYAYMQEYTDGRRYGFVEQHSTPYYASAWINGYGGEILHDDGTPGLNDEAVVESLEYHKKFIDYMPRTSADYATVNTLFLEESADMVIGGPWMIPSALEAGIDIGVAPMPTLPSGKPLSPYSGVQGIQALKIKCRDSGRKERIKAVMECFLDPSVQGELALVSGCAPALEAAYEVEGVKDSIIVKAIQEQAATAIPMPSRPEMDIMWSELGYLLTDVNMNGAAVEETADKYQAEALRLIEQMQ